MKMSLPCSAGAFDPETGASRNAAPWPLTACSTRCMVVTSTVELSM